MHGYTVVVAAVGASLFAASTFSQAGRTSQGRQSLPLTPQRLFETRCMNCHGNPNVDRAPSPTALRLRAPDAIIDALSSGTTHLQAAQLTDAQKRGVAEYLAGRNMTPEGAGDAARMTNKCAANPAIRNVTTTPAWNGWGGDLTNGRFQSRAAAGLDAAEVPRLKLKWAFGLPGATMMYGQPTVVAGRVFVSGNTGAVYSLDAATGCVYWSFQAQSAVRTATSVGPIKTRESNRFAAYFGDQRAYVYAVDAATGTLFWKVRVDEHGLAGITGAPTLYDGRLYVPVSSREEPAGVATVYPCCTFRGSIVALDASTGRQVWKTHIIPEEPQPTRKNVDGTQLYAPSGGAVWNAPTIDPRRRVLYVGTGNSTSEPAAINTDAVMAMAMDTGKILWAVQDTKNDAWLVCFNEITDNCPKNMGPDYDFGASMMLRALPNGRRILVAGQKSGMVWAHDADRQGEVVWSVQLPEKLALGEITFGGAADADKAYFGLRSGGIAAISLATGERRWFVRLPGQSPSGDGGQTAALTLIPGVVFSGGWDGMLRALATDDGRLLWEFRMKDAFTTVNGVPGKGGAMGSAGPTVAAGMMFVGSGYVFGGGNGPGNVLLAFSAR